MNLDKGLLLEDTNTLLEWGKPIDTLPVDSKQTQGSRTIIRFGPHKILGGLDLDLIMRFDYHEVIENFSFAEHWAIGDKPAIESFNRIGVHLTSVLGPPVSKDESRFREKIWIWKNGKIEIRLYLFEQHCFKTVLTIKKKE